MADVSLSRLSLPAADGAIELLLEVQRQGYQGPIELAWQHKSPDLELIGDLIPAGAKEHRLLIAVSPEIIDNQVTGRVRFNDAVPAGLRQNQRLTTRVLLEEKFDVLMVQRGQFFDSGNGRVAYLVDDDVAYRRSIVTGATSLNSIEIVDGLQAGDTIVVSSTDSFNGADTVLIN